MMFYNLAAMALPVSVILPTRNCRQALEKHLDAVGHCLADAGQVIAVDSESTDGTYEVLVERLARFGAVVLSRPPGLYQSWNAAIDTATAPWIYFSTMGEEIDPEGLRELVSAAERHQADVVISPPRMMQQDGVTPAEIRWPIHFLAEALGGDAEPRLLSKLETVIGLCSYGSGSILGSSASNLYRTALLREFPFPSEFGHAGDTAWAMQNCARLRMAVLPRPLSTFCLGWQFEESDPRLQRELYLRLANEGITALAAASQQDPDVRSALGWLRALVANQTVLWDWLANQAGLVQEHAELRDYLQQVEAEKARTLRARVKRILGR